MGCYIPINESLAYFYVIGSDTCHSVTQPTDKKWGGGAARGGCVWQSHLNVKTILVEHTRKERSLGAQIDVYLNTMPSSCFGFLLWL